ncbi:MAG: hypothetical protein GY873_12745, partial [Bosea sp.]|uniref:hypothetical protein n=1 Tax=Bosea sp. (in: a-proteobacteria) TaxID=1871050 RepID=UPI0023A1ED31|nr:hypothetical protein [Bosea sp. (in: a-proteobacteria)]
AGNTAAASVRAGNKKKSGPLESGSEYPDSEYETDDESVCSRSSAGSSRRPSSSGAGSGRRLIGQQKKAPCQRKKSTIIWIVDLAGSERSKRTRSTTRHQKEAALINASLMNLMRCLREMLNHQPAGKKRGGGGAAGVVPFRESKLTHMFMNHLTGSAASRTSMIVNVNPAADDYDETQHVLSYAAMARNVTISAVDYNRNRRMFAKESVVKKAMKTGKASPPKKKALLSKLAKKLSPKKRKGTIESASNVQRSKRLRGNSPAVGGSGNKLGYRAGGGASSSARKPPPSKAYASGASRSRVPKGGVEELEQLREEKFALQVTVEDLRKQLADSEAEVRTEVVEMMGEQLEERKALYEGRIVRLQAQVAALQSSERAQMDHQNEKAEILNECKEEMKRMREEHDAEVEAMWATHFSLVWEHD